MLLVDEGDNLTPEDELTFHFENNDPISLYESCMRIYNDSCGIKLNDVAMLTFKKMVLSCFDLNPNSYRSQSNFENLKFTLDGLINPSHKTDTL